MRRVDVAIIGGGASGIGADIVRAFAGQGAKVGFLDIQDDAGAAEPAVAASARG